MSRYRLIQGTAILSDAADVVECRRVNAALPIGVERVSPPDKVYRASEPGNNIIETEFDLEALYNAPNARKFEKIHESIGGVELGNNPFTKRPEESVNNFLDRMKKIAEEAQANATKVVQQARGVVDHASAQAPPHNDPQSSLSMPGVDPTSIDPSKVEKYRGDALATFESMTVKELIGMAAEEEIDISRLGQSPKKADLVRTIMDATGGITR